MKSGLSILIPTWEMYDSGVPFLKFSFDKLRSQTFQNFEIVITDDSENEDIKNLCSDYLQYFEVHYHKNPNPPGIPVHASIKTEPKGSVNTNYGITKCNREIIKFLFQDDFLIDDMSLEYTYNTFKENNSKWLVTDCAHSTDGVNITRRLTPHYHHNIHHGINTISSPSILSVVNDNVLLFDESLVILMDCDYYKRLYMRYGLPTILQKVTGVNRIHPGQITHNCDEGQDYILDLEKQYTIRKFLSNMIKLETREYHEYDNAQT